LWFCLSEKLGVGADAGETKFIIDHFADQKEIGPDMAFHVTGPDADKRMWPTPVGKRVVLLQQGNHRGKSLTGDRR
jgi:hypothetical protein